MQETIPTLVRRCADPACGLEFTPRTPWQKYHSPCCRTRHWERLRGRRRREPSLASHLSCPHCGQPVALTLEPALYPPKPSA